MSFKDKSGRAGFIPFTSIVGIRRCASFRSQKVSLRADIIDTQRFFGSGVWRIALWAPKEKFLLWENLTKT